MTVRESTSRTGWLSAAILCLQLGCLGEEAVQGKLLVTDHRTQALTSAELASVNGTYGAACRNRFPGSWSLAAVPGADLDHDALSVVQDDISCVLTLTEFHTGAPQAIAASPEIELTTTFGAEPSAFGAPVEFYANAALDDVSFADAFTLTVLYSDDPRLGTATNIARPVPPRVVLTVPLAGAVGRSIATRPRATFDVAMDPTTLTNANFTVRQGMVDVPGVVTVDVLNLTATFTPTAALELASAYDVTISTGVENALSTPLDDDFVWQFTTAAISQGPLYLESALAFAVLAGTTVTNTGPSVITGDLGVSPNLSVTGFPSPGTLNGTQHAGDTSADQAQADLAAAVMDATSRALGSSTLSGDLGGRTLAPGLYTSIDTLAVDVGDLTLDASGEEDAVFLIRMVSTLTLGVGSEVVLAGGARAENVYWLVGSSATLGTNSLLQGTIMADQSITLTNGAELNGRALARAGAVTLDNNTVSRPPP